jgi:hypothetical protein
VYSAALINIKPQGGFFLPSKIVKNRADHVINVVANSEYIQFPECAEPLRAEGFDRKLYRIDNGIPVIQNLYYNDPQNLPPKESGTVYITSKLFATLYRDIRNDFVYPATDPVRDRAKYDGKTLNFVRHFRRPSQLIEREPE